METFDDWIPLGLSGTVKLPPLQDGSDRVQAGRILWTEEERLAWLVGRLDRQLDHPLTAPGSNVVARRVLDLLPVDPCPEFAKKLLLSLRDGQMHSTLAFRQDPPHVAVCFVAWQGSWRELIGRRYGRYLSSICGTMDRVTKHIGSLSGFLQIDAFIQESVLEENPQRDLEECIMLDVEYSYFPSWPFGPPLANDAGLLSNVILLNRDLCSEEEKTAMARLL